MTTPRAWIAIRHIYTSPRSWIRDRLTFDLNGGDLLFAGRALATLAVLLAAAGVAAAAVGISTEMVVELSATSDTLSELEGALRQLTQASGSQPAARGPPPYELSSGELGIRPK
jgi:hypothetical protein